MTQKDAVNYSQNYLSAVGSLSGSQSAYGTFDQNGGVWEVLSNNKRAPRKINKALDSGMISFMIG